MGSIPKISIGLPVCNGERYLALALESVLSQTFTDFELIISDNASTDWTWAICCEYSAKDNRIRLNRNSANVGAVKNFQMVLARGKYLMWMAHDDMLAETCLAACYDFIYEKGSNLLLAYTYPFNGWPSPPVPLLLTPWGSWRPCVLSCK
jgi:glycosyltransferase involved in cell wall biosynthesis